MSNEDKELSRLMHRQFVNTSVIFIIALLLLSKEVQEFVGGYKWILAVLLSLLTLHELGTILYIIIIPVRDTWVRHIMFKSIRKVIEKDEENE